MTTKTTTRKLGVDQLGAIAILGPKLTLLQAAVAFAFLVVILEEDLLFHLPDTSPMGKLELLTETERTPASTIKETE